jgi:hypothetical protein
MPCPYVNIETKSPKVHPLIRFGCLAELGYLTLICDRA